MKKKGKKGGKMYKAFNPQNGCGGKKGSKCEIPYVMPHSGTKEEFAKHVEKSLN